MEFDNQNQQVVECVRKIESGAGYASMWFQLNKHQRNRIEKICKGDLVKKRKIVLLRGAEVLLTSVEEPVEESQESKGNECLYFFR